ncbi:MAG: hypothetical protein ACRDRX_12885 [Pseudonocardiaceae bacterium]
MTRSNDAQAKCELDAALVAVDARDVGHECAEAAGQGALSAADVERALAACGNGADDHRVVAEVVIPPPGVVAHQPILHQVDRVRLDDRRQQQ